MGATLDAVTQVVAVVRAVTGIQQADVNPAENQSTALFAVPYVSRGVVKMAPVGARADLFDITFDVLKVRTWLPNDMAALWPLLDLIPSALQAQIAPGGAMFGGKVQTFKEVQFILLPKVEYADTPLIGYRFTMVDSKILVG